MGFTARIPSHVIFNVRDQKQLTPRPSRTAWERLAAADKHQKDTVPFQESILKWNYWAPSTAKEIERHENHKFSYVHENKPVKLTLVGYNFDSMEAALPSGHVVDLPLDVLLMAIKTSGIGKDKKTLPGKYILVMANRKLVPVQVGSGVHKAVLDHIKLRKTKKFDVKELVVGNVYKTAAGNTALFLGYVNTETIVVDTPKGVSKWYPRMGTNFDPSDEIRDFGVRFLKKNLASLWYETRLQSWQGEKHTPEVVLDSLYERLKKKSIGPFKCKKSHRYVQKIEDFYVDVPTDIVMQIRAMFNNRAKKQIDEARLRRGNKADYYTPVVAMTAPPDKLRHYDACQAEELSAECNMTLFGLGVIRSEVYKQFEPWETKKKKY